MYIIKRHEMSRNVIFYASAILEYRYPVLYYGVKALQSFSSCIMSLISLIVFFIIRLVLPS